MSEKTSTKLNIGLSNHPVVYKSIRRLQSIGLKVYAEDIGDNVCMIIIDRDSIIKTIIKLIRKQLTYPNNAIVYDDKENAIVGFFWKGELPKNIEERIRGCARY
ncbi:MAG: hypothetical protein QXS21_05945 [Thermoproteota archaeon]